MIALLAGASIGVASTLGVVLLHRYARGSKELGSDGDHATFRTLHLASQAASHLRRGLDNDEVDRATGRFCHNISSGLPAECLAVGGGSRVEGIIKTFDRIRLYDAGNFNASAAGARGFVIPKEIVNGQFPSWGNPMSEMVVQALAYLAGRPSFDQPASMARDGVLNLPVNVAPRDPLSNSSIDAASGLTRGSLYGKGICRPMHLLAISSGSVSFDAPGSSDGDTYSSADYFLRANGQSRSLADWTDMVGDASREGADSGQLG